MKERQRWQPEEDALLRAYVKQYGPREWNLISQRMPQPLHRDPKSCLERWKNYLKPGLKKGSLTPEEQSLVISLQAKYGNKWKKIAAEVPGRTAKRLGKWWEVFKEKQLKLQQKQQKQNLLHNNLNPNHPHKCSEYSHSDCTDTVPTVAVGSTSSSDKVGQGPYDHILDTFAEKYVLPQPKNMAPVLSGISLSDPDPVLSLGSNTPTTTTTSSSPVSVIPLWMNMNMNMNMNVNVSTTSSSATSSTTPSPSVSLSLSPSDPGLDPDINPTRVYLGQQMGTLVQYVKEVEEGRQSWVQHRKEASWRLSRLEQQLESEKARKRREKMEEIEAKIRCLREEELAFFGRIESEYKEELNALHTDAETKEAKLVESWSSKHVKLAKLVDQIGLVHASTHGFTAL